MASRFCPQCGAPTGANERYCRRCGAPLAERGWEQAGMPGTLGYGRAGLSVPYAGFWIRLLAWLIDAIILSIINEIVSRSFGIGSTLIINLVINFAYYVVAFSQWGQTVGALAVGIKVVDVNGGLLSPAAAFIRTIGAAVSALPFFLGYFWMLWDGRKQTWHDKMAGSIVVKAERAG
jgi:uncharacterized RDD family membrane protein YckC